LLHLKYNPLTLKSHEEKMRKKWETNLSQIIT